MLVGLACCMLHDDDLDLWFSSSGFSRGNQDPAQVQSQMRHMMHHVELVRVARFGYD